MSIVKERSVVKLDSAYESNMHLYAPLGCGFQTGAGTVLNVLKPGPETSIAIFGMGCVGIAALLAAKYMGAGQIIAVDIVQSKLDLARELGATHCINSRETPGLLEALKQATGGEGVNLAVDCTGVIPVINTAIDALAPCGTAALVGMPPPEAKLSFDAGQFVKDNKRLVGVIEGDANPQKVDPVAGPLFLRAVLGTDSV